MKQRDMSIPDIVSKLTTEEKARLCSGADFWHTKEIKRLGIPAVMMSDGPHGLRVQRGDTDHMGINESEPATCFPAACASASSFDRDLIRRMGEAIGEEAREKGVSLVLGPGANLKRNPLCGRNFEYFSEDPYVSGQLAAAWIKGLQSRGVGACLKHFAANNQERARFINNSIVDERALHELYLSAFETAVKEARPWSVMSSYNRLNGLLTSESKWLMTDLLRGEWGFGGLVVTDWGGVNDRAAAMKAGVDLEMPYLGSENDRAILDAVKNGRVSEEELDAAVTRILELTAKSHAEVSEPKYSEDEYKSGSCVDASVQRHHQLAQEIAEQSAVLLKNEENLLPLPEKARIAVIGDFAKAPRYQGAGSSRINPHKLDVPADVLVEAGFETVYAKGYDAGEKEPDPAKIRDAADAAAQCDYAVVFAGLPALFESEGYDRTTLDMPASHNALIEAVAAANPNTVVILMCGAPVLMPWRNRVKAILLMYLGGQAVGTACARLLSGAASPGGRLAETWPTRSEDVPSVQCFSNDTFHTEYRESIYVGYRWYDSAHREPAYPFGYGLSYTTFHVGAASIESGDGPVSIHRKKRGQSLVVTASVTNTGKRQGSEILQVYVRKKDSAVMRPDKELKEFVKLTLAPGETGRTAVTLDDRAFACYDAAAKCWQVEAGTYEVLIGTSSRNILHVFTVEAEGERLENAVIPAAYEKLPAEGAFDVPSAEFKMLFRGAYPRPERQERARPAFTRNSIVGDLKLTFIGRKILNIIESTAEAGIVENDSDDMNVMARMGLHEYPLRTLAMSGALSLTQIDGIIDILNGHPLRGVKKFRAGEKKEELK